MAARPNNQAAIAGYIQGLREAKAAFQALEPTFREHMADATETTVREIARGAQARLRSSPSIQTRNLHNAVGWSMNRKNGRGRAGITNTTTTLNVGGRRIRVKGIITAGRGGSALKSAGARVDRPGRRAHFVEFGTRTMKAEPFMVPAAAAEKGPYLDRAKQAGKLAEKDLAAIGRRNA
jgi:HK97 gp10 family phage protein